MLGLQGIETEVLPDHQLQPIPETYAPAHPKAVVAVFLLVDNEFFLGFAVQSHADDGVLLALVMLVASWGMLVMAGLHPRTASIPA